MRGTRANDAALGYLSGIPWGPWLEAYCVSSRGKRRYDSVREGKSLYWIQGDSRSLSDKHETTATGVRQIDGSYDILIHVLLLRRVRRSSSRYQKSRYADLAGTESQFFSKLSKVEPSSVTNLLSCWRGTEFQFVFRDRLLHLKKASLSVQICLHS